MPRLQAAFVRFGKNLVTQGSGALQKIIPALLSVPTAFMDRHTQRSLVTALAGIEAGEQSLALLLQLTYDDPGTPLVRLHLSMCNGDAADLKYHRSKTALSFLRLRSGRKLSAHRAETCSTSSGGPPEF